MKKIIDRIVQSPGAPGTYDLWLTEDNQLKVYNNEEWKTINGGGSSDDGGGGSASPVLDWIFPGLIGFVDVTDDDWPVDTSGGYGNWVLTGDIIPVDQLKEYVKSYAVERYGHILGTRTFNYVLEYDEAFDNQSPSFRGIEFTYDGDRDIIYMGSFNTFSFNAKILKDGVAYLVGFDPGD